MKKIIISIFLLIVITLTNCVSAKKYNSLLHDLGKTADQLRSCQLEYNVLVNDTTYLRREVKELEKK